jgi:hypothetical protein
MTQVTVAFKVKGVEFLQGRLDNGIGFLRMEIPNLTYTEAHNAATFARNIAPLRTGALIMGIGTSSRGKTKYSIVSKMPRGQNRKQPRPYHAMMHGTISPKIPAGHIKSGDPHYMFTTYKRLKEGFPRKVRERLRKTISGKGIYTG